MIHASTGAVGEVPSSLKARAMFPFAGTCRASRARRVPAQARRRDAPARGRARGRDPNPPRCDPRPPGGTLILPPGGHWRAPERER